MNKGILTVTDSTFSDNDSGTTRHGGAISNDFGATLTVVGSTFNGNSASEGGAIQNRISTATISNSTFSGNSASNSGGGLDNIGTGFSTTINNSTFTGNSAGSGGGVFNIFGTITLNNTIVFGNSGGTTAREDCFGAGISSLGHNLVGIGTGCPTGGTGDLTTADAKLAPALADNGGPTKTHALLTGSPAIGAGDPAAPGTGGTACEATDQRGTSRPQGTRCDIGAFELVLASATPVPGVTWWGLLASALLFGAVIVWRRNRKGLPSSP